MNLILLTIVRVYDDILKRGRPILRVNPRHINTAIRYFGTELIDELFGKESAPITLSSIHRAKGMEWDHVFWLDEQLIPSRWAIKANEADPDLWGWMMQEEYNISYVCMTRARDTMTFIQSDNFERLG